MVIGNIKYIHYKNKLQFSYLIFFGFFFIVSCREKEILSSPTAFRNDHTTGQIFKHTLESKTFNDSRDIFVWIPVNYNSTTKKYPVLILHDGQNVFYPGGSMSGNEWHLDETVSELIQSNKMEDIIMVGVSNTVSRSKEYNPLEDGKRYGQYLVGELLPEISKQYRIKTDYDNRASMGASMGGLISMYLGWELKSEFSKVACLSPAFSYKNFNYIDKIQTLPKPKNLKLAIVNGTEDLDSLLQSGVDQCIDYLNTAGFSEDNLLYWVSQGDSHSELAWARQSKKILVWMFPK